MKSDAILTYSESLVNKGKNLLVKDFIGKLTKKYYPDVEPRQVNELYDLVDKSGFVVPLVAKLIEYDVYTANSVSNDIRKALIAFKYLENIDYMVVKTNQFGANGIEKIEYMSTTQVFKEMLVRTRNTNIFARYYVFFETAVQCYDKYQIMMLTREISVRDTKIDELLTEMRDMRISMKSEFDKVLTEITVVKDQNTDLQNTVDTVTDQNVKLQETVEVVKELQDKTVEKLECASFRQVVPTINPDNVGVYMVLKPLTNRKITDHNYYQIRGNLKSARDSLRTFEAKCPQYEILIESSPTPNPVADGQLLRERLWKVEQAEIQG